jgi:hypothetical protein
MTDPLGQAACHMTAESERFPGRLTEFAGGYTNRIDNDKETKVRTPYDANDDIHCDGGPFVAEADVIGLYRPDIAAAASRYTACNTGSETKIDD